MKELVGRFYPGNGSTPHLLWILMLQYGRVTLSPGC